MPTWTERCSSAGSTRLLLLGLPRRTSRKKRRTAGAACQLHVSDRAASKGRAMHCAGPVVRPCVQAEEQETDAFKNRKRATTKSTKSDSKLHDSLPDFMRNLTTYELIPNKSSLGINPNSGKSRTENRRLQNRRKTGPNQNKSRPNFS